jgi:NADH-quinone oxidoreductase subunit L
VSHIPFYLGCFGALLTAFYMTRQVVLVFFGSSRRRREESHSNSEVGAHDAESKLETPHVVSYKDEHTPHESPLVMTAPLMILAFFAVALGFIGTPAWPWFQDFLEGHHAEYVFANLKDKNFLWLAFLSMAIVFSGIGLGIWLYYFNPPKKADEPDVLEKLPLGMHAWFANKYGIDELYEMTVIRFNAWFARVCDFLDAWVWGGVVLLVSLATVGLGWVNDSFDKFVINLGFDGGCEGVARGGSLMSKLQDGRVQNYLRLIGVALVALALFLIWGGGK